MSDRRAQLGFLEAFAAPGLGRNERLEKIASILKPYRFEKLLKQLEPEGAGRPPKEVVMMFRALLLAQLYNLSDPALEDALNDRMSFRRFVGLPLEEPAPDYSTIWRFRERLSETGLLGKLFAEFDKQLAASGMVLKRGTILDATLVDAAAGRPRGDDIGTDPDAKFAKKQGQPGSVYGYKAHIAMDQESELIRAAHLTPANVNETSVADQLIRGDEQAVYADKGYAKAERRQMLRAHGIRDCIMHKSWGGGPPLSEWQKRVNRRIARTRSRVETVFAIWKKHMGFRRTRYFGLARNRTQLLLLVFAYNLRRLTVLRPT
jgi:IS5 family transposase